MDAAGNIVSATLSINYPFGSGVTSSQTGVVLKGKAPRTVVSRDRFHHQYEPDRIEHEPATFTQAEKQALRATGHSLHNVDRTFGNMQLIQRHRRSGTIQGAADPRGIGSAGLTHQAAGSE